MTVATATIALNISFEGLLLMVVSIMMKIIEVAYSKKHTKLKTRGQKPYPRVFMTKTAE